MSLLGGSTARYRVIKSLGIIDGVVSYNKISH